MQFTEVISLKPRPSDNCHISQSDCATQIPAEVYNVVLYLPAAPPFLIAVLKAGGLSLRL